MSGVSNLVPEPTVYRFGVFRVDVCNRELQRKGTPIKIQEKPLQILESLIQKRGEVVTREELRQKLWPDGTFIEFDDGLNTGVKKLRAALGDVAENPTFIETVPKRGWRFIAPVFCESADEPARNGHPESAPLPQPSPETVPAAARQHRISWRAAVSVIAPALLLLAIATALVVRGKTPPAAPVSAEIHSLAVLPLKNLSKDPGEQYFADGMTEELITSLASLEGLRVISRTSVMQYRDSTKLLPQIAAELHVDAIVEGAILRSGDRVRVTAQLVQGATDHHLWAQSYERDQRDVLSLQNEVARDISHQIRLKLAVRTSPSEPHREIDPVAFQDFLQGRYYFSMRTRDSLLKSIDYFNRSLEKDPSYARSYAGLAHSYIVLPFLTNALDQDVAYPKARQAAEKALALDESVPEAHLAVAEVKLYQNWDFAGAEPEFEKTVELDPNYATGHQWYGEFLSLMSRHPEAIAQSQITLALDPLSAVAHLQAANTYQQARQYQKAVNEYREALRINPRWWSGLFYAAQRRNL